MTLLLWVVLFLLIAGILQLSLSSLLVVVSSLALAVGLALKDSLSNLANGILIIYNKPFRRGDHVSINGVDGRIHNIKLLTTEIINFNNEKIIVPNSTVVSSSLINYTACPTRRISYSFGVAYGSDMDKVERVVLEALKSDAKVLEYPEPYLFISSHSSSSFDYSLRLWVKTSEYWDIYNGLGRKLYDLLGKNDIEIPFTQVDLHIKESSQAAIEKLKGDNK